MGIGWRTALTTRSYVVSNVHASSGGCFLFVAVLTLFMFPTAKGFRGRSTDQGHLAQPEAVKIVLDNCAGTIAQAALCTPPYGGAARRLGQADCNEPEGRGHRRGLGS